MVPGDDDEAVAVACRPRSDPEVLESFVVVRRSRATTATSPGVGASSSSALRACLALRSSTYRNSSLEGSRRRGSGSGPIGPECDSSTPLKLRG